MPSHSAILALLVWLVPALESASGQATDDPVTFNSGNIAPGASFSYTFDEAATIPYVCVYHPNMRATLTVE